MLLDFRLRTYPGLKYSFSMPQTTSFRPFYIRFRLKNVILQGEVFPEDLVFLVRGYFFDVLTTVVMASLAIDNDLVYNI